MIDVPVQVKDALRDGRMKKNYRFVTQKIEKERNIVDVAVLNNNNLAYNIVLKDYYVLHISPTESPLQLQIHLIQPNIGDVPGGNQLVRIMTSTTDEVFYYVNYALNVGGQIAVVPISGTLPDIGITRRDLIYYNDVLTDDFVIDNNNLVSESVSIDERMCSGDTLKFGLCEGSNLEFQYFGKENITGRQIKAFIDVEYKAPGYEYETIAQFFKYQLLTITEAGAYRVLSSIGNAYNSVWLARDEQSTEFYPTVSESGTELFFENLQVGDKLEVEWSGEVYDTYLQSAHEAIVSQWHSIPMGFYIVKKCSRQASTGIMKATAYNKLQSDYLDQKANDLVKKLYSHEQSVLLYDVKNILLNGYEIELSKEEEQVSRSADWGHIYKLSGGSITFKAKYGINTPLSWYEYNNVGGTNTTVYPFIISEKSEATLNSTRDYQVDFVYDMADLEQSYFNKIKDLMTKSFNVSESYMDRFFTPQTSSGSYYESFLGWHQYCGVCVTKLNGTKLWYSTLAYNHGLSDVAGTFEDLKNTTLTGCTKIEFYFPYDMQFSSSSSNTGYVNMVLFWYGSHEYHYFTDSELILRQKGVFTWLSPDGQPTDTDWIASGWSRINRILGLTVADKTVVDPWLMPDFTLRDITSACYELQCQFGQLSRESDLFSGVELNHSSLYPADTLYPANALYPDGAQASSFRSQYSKLWADEGNIHKWRNLIISYKGLDENQVVKDFVLTRQINEDGTDDYICDDNWVLKNLVWTWQDIYDFSSDMKEKMQPITWFPFEMWGAGLPYLETGDQIEIPLGEETYTSYILQRNLKGIQNLQDTYINGTLDIF